MTCKFIYLTLEKVINLKRHKLTNFRRKKMFFFYCELNFWALTKIEHWQEKKISSQFTKSNSSPSLYQNWASISKLTKGKKMFQQNDNKSSFNVEYSWEVLKEWVRVFPLFYERRVSKWKFISWIWSETWWL